MDAFKKSQLVHGYIQFKISFRDVPYDIIRLIDQFLCFCDRWDASYLAKDGMKIEVNKNTIIISNTSRTTTAYGQAVFDKTTGIQVCKLKLLDDSNPCGWFALIGIVQNNDKWLIRNLNSSSGFRGRKGYGFIAGRGQIVSVPKNDLKSVRKPYGEIFGKQGDTMEVVLDVKMGELKYIVNDTDYGIAFDDIDQNKEYRLAISINSTSVCSIQLS